MANDIYTPNMADILYGGYIRYERMYEMTKYAFYGENDLSKFQPLNIFIDCYSILRSLYSRGDRMLIKDSYAIASCLINLGIHIRAYFEGRHHVQSKVYLIYGGARPREAFVNYYQYNAKNILTEDSNYELKSLIMDNLKVMNILCPYLYDIFCIVDLEHEFNTITSYIIDQEISQQSAHPNIIYGKDMLDYQLVAFKPYTFLYRPKKRGSADCSWVATKKTLYNAYRYGELGLTKEYDTSLNVKMFSIFQALSGVRTRNMNHIKVANTAIKLLEKGVMDGAFNNGYNSSSIFYEETNPFFKLLQDQAVASDATNRFAAIDLPYQTMLYSASLQVKELPTSIINLYNPDEMRAINNKYFKEYPLDLNRV